ncbi:hypothetical protein CK203_042572 [Vitis vinifera]|uniref:Ubiquitin-like protease family profile domain-containing protein n=1 Tax=Vitis vinifera TaxID=29760 RepID=A0A438I7P0_VITVI|nr:hypothetical protein CK203_042572 [Vitis vinifera]
MDSRQRKRRSHVPSRSEAVKLPKSRCLGKKFLSIMDTFPMDKKNAFSDMGFGGLLQLGCKELRYELITWIVANYDIGYHRLCMETKVAVPITPKDVKEVLGIPDNGVDILIYNRHGTPNHIYDIKILEANLRDLLVGEEFMKSFLIFAYATILAPNSKQEGMHDLWDTVWDSEVGLFYITKFYMTAFQVEVRSPLSAAWIDELYREANLLHIMMDVHTRRATHTLMTQLRSSEGQSDCALTPPEEAMNVERKKDEGSTGVHPYSDEMIGKGTGATNTHFGQQRVTGAAVDDGPCIDHHTCPLSQKSVELQSLKGVQMGVQEGCGSKQPSPTPRQRFKHTAKMLVEPAAICKSPSSLNVFNYFLKSANKKGWLRIMRCQKTILCDMHDTYITRDELSSLNGGRWVNSVLFFPVCDNNHWHVHVVNIPASRVEILSSLPLRRGNGISVVSRRLSEAIDKAFHAHGMLSDWRYDCGMFAIKYMEHWNEATLAHSIAEDKMHLYRLRLVITLVTNVANNARDKVLKVCRI